MTFQSLEYLIFLPVVFILYRTLCRGSKMLQNGLIVAASLVFTDGGIGGSSDCELKIPIVFGRK